MGLLAADGEAGAQRVSVSDPIGAVSLQAVDESSAIDVRGDAIEEEIADLIGDEMQRRITRKIGKLRVDGPGRMRQGYHVVKVALVLNFVELRGVEPADAESFELGWLIGIIGNVEIRDGGSGDEGELRRIVDRVGRIAKEPS